MRLWRAYAWLLAALTAIVVAFLRLRFVILTNGMVPELLAVACGSVLLPVSLADIRKAHWQAAQRLDLEGPPDAPDIGTFAYGITEYRAVEAFRREHDKHNRGGYTYAFHPTGIADKKTVACSCGATADVSDYESW